MVYGAIDLHMRYSQIRIVDADGAVLREQRVSTTPARLVETFGGHGAMRILLETGTESEWVAQTLEAAGHEVIVADPNYAPMYGEIRRKVKTDRRDVADTIAPLRRMVETLSDEIDLVDARLQTVAAADPLVTRLRSVPGVGLIVALTFRAVVDDVGRFTSAGQVSAAIGLVPREDSSAERRHRGHITKAGPSELRSLLIQAAWACWRSKGSGTLRAWVERLAARRGRRIAVVALARRLSRILYALWRDQSVFDAATLAAA